jgi:putative peptidoglycan lipid II flippase
MKSQSASRQNLNSSQESKIKITATIQAPNLKSEKHQILLTPGNNRFQIGRAGQNEICLADESVSTFHASLLMRADGHLIISDLESRGGTFLNGKRLEPGKSFEINQNDEVRAGAVVIRFEWSFEPELLSVEEVKTATSDAQAQDSQPMPPAVTVEAEENLPPQALPAVVAETQSPQTTVSEAEKPQRSVARSAGIVSIAVMASRVMGLVREMVFARFFGAGFLTDAFLVGFRIPNLLRDLFAEGALSAAFVKVFTDYQIKRGEREAWRLASLVLNALVVVLSVITILGVVFARPIVGLIARDFPPEKAALAATLTQIMFPFILLVAMAALAMGVLNTRGKFGVPASASTAFNIVSLVAGLACAYFLSGGSWQANPPDPNAAPEAAAQWAIIGMAIGTLIGGAAQFLIQVPSLWKVGFRFVPALDFRDEGVRRVAVLMAPALIGVGAIQIKVMVDTFLISSVNGGVSWLSYAFRLMQFPIGVFGVAIGTAATPTLARFVAENDFAKFRQTIAGAFNLVFLLTIPSACGLIVLGEPIIRLIYEWGKFDARDTTMTTWALIGYSIGLTGYAAIKIVSPAFYALDDARTPMYVSVASILIHVVTGYTMMQILSGVGATPENPSGLAHVGVTLATSTVATVNFLVLLLIMRSRIGRIEGRSMLAAFVKIGFAALLMSAAAHFIYRALANYLGTDGLFVRLVEVFVPIAVGGAVFVTTAKLLGVKELNQLFGAFARKLKR